MDQDQGFAVLEVGKMVEWDGDLPLGSAAAKAANSSTPPPSPASSLCDLFFFLGLSPLNLSFLDTTPDILTV